MIQNLQSPLLRCPSKPNLQHDLHASFCTFLPRIQSELRTWTMVVFLKPTAAGRGMWPLPYADDGLLSSTLAPWLSG